MAPTRLSLGTPSPPPSFSAKATKDEEGEEAEEDYMSMTIPDPSTYLKVKETSIQRRARRAREAELKARVPSKQEASAAAAAARDASLATSLDPSNKGFKMLSKLGYTPGGGLGKAYGGDAPRTEPISLVLKEDRGGIGLDSEKKRKFREQVESEAKRVKAEEGEYRERVRREREERRVEGQVVGAQKVAEKLDAEAEEGVAAQDNAEVDGSGGDGAEDHEEAMKPGRRKTNTKPTKQMNVLWRGLVRRRLEEERERRMRYDLQQSLSRLPTYDDPDEDRDDKLAMGTLEEELDEEDPELEVFNALEPPERLERLVRYLRDTYHYCFWCKFRYEDDAMEGCPGLSEDEHG